MTFEEKINLLNNYYVEVRNLKSLLSETDYQTIREFEGGEPMSEETRKKRADIRKRINELEELITKTNEIEPEVPDESTYNMDMMHLHEEAENETENEIPEEVGDDTNIDIVDETESEVTEDIVENTDMPDNDIEE